MCVCVRVHVRVSERECDTVLCLRFAETGRGFADKWRGQVTAQRDYHKGKEEEERKKKKEAQKIFLACPSTPALRLSTDSWHTNENRL